MAVVNNLSTALTNTYAARPKLNPSQIDVGRARQSVGVAVKAAADSNNSVYRICKVHSSWRVSSIRVSNSAITGGTSYAIGLYTEYVDGQTPIEVVTGSKSLLAAVVDMSTARTVPTEVLTMPTSGKGVEQALWERLGLTSDPGAEYDVALTATTAGSTVGEIGVMASFVGIG